MAKSAARQWGADGITVNSVLVPVETAGTGDGRGDVVPAAAGARVRADDRRRGGGGGRRSPIPSATA